MIYDVIIVGSGPGGSSAATFLSKQGLSVLLLDKAKFPRDKVCGDGLTPQAIIWLDKLGCVDQVLSQAKSCITSSDLFINGNYALTGRFPQNTSYPSFGTCLERSKLDHLLVLNAITHGAHFKQNLCVKNLIWQNDCIAVEAASDKKTVKYKGRLLIGSDGANSLISRCIGNVLKDGTVAVSMRAYYEGVKVDRSPMRIYVNKDFFPGYGWLFADYQGKANIGFGYLSDSKFPMKSDLRKMFNDFIQSDMKQVLKGAHPIGRPEGWWACYSKPKSIVADRVMLIGDAANHADPMNGAGIHKAMEDAYLAAKVAVEALSSGDYSKQKLSCYEKVWNERTELDWRVGELFTAIVKNPNLREFYIFLLTGLSQLTKEDQQVKDFCSGVFSGVIPQSVCLSPRILFDIIPKERSAWAAMLRYASEIKSQDVINLAFSSVNDSMKITSRILTNPGSNLAWGSEVLVKTFGLMGCYAKKEISSLF